MPAIGQIYLFVGNFAPMGFHMCDGTQFNINGNESLFSIVGTTYGGDGRTNFCIPKIAPLESSGGKVSYMICIEGTYPDRTR